MRTPEPPTDTARMLHNMTHVPFQNWCLFYVACRARSSPHRRVVVNKTADTLPKFQEDYMFIRTVAETKTQPCITFVETRGGAVISFMCARKGGYEDRTREFLRHFESYSFLNLVILQCDKDMSNTGERKEVCHVSRQTESSEHWFRCSSTRTPARTCTMLPNTNSKRTLVCSFQRQLQQVHSQFVTQDLCSQGSQ